jgi:hypothetical protein
VRRRGFRAALLALAGLILALLLVACGQKSKAAPCRVCAAELAQTRADTYAAVAKRTLAEEVYGTPNGYAFHIISTIPDLLRGLATQDYALARQAMHHQPVRHAVAVRVTKGHKTLINVGLRFVIGGRIHALHDSNGKYLGRMEVSIQDAIGFIRLIHRLTGCEVVVAGSTGQSMSSLAAASGVALPTAGPIAIAGREYTVSSFGGRGFAGEPLRISILDPS